MSALNLPGALASLHLLRALTHTNELSVNVLKASPDRVAQRLLDLLLHEPVQKRAERLVQNVVLRVADRPLERVDVHVDVLDLEDGGSVLAGGGEVDGALQ